MSFAPSTPHEYWRWSDHTAVSANFKKEMWVHMLEPNRHNAAGQEWGPQQELAIRMEKEDGAEAEEGDDGYSEG